jgi:hypothetical protein
MKAPPPHIDLEQVRKLLEQLASFRITNWADWPPETQEFLKMCATYVGFPEDIRALAWQCIYMPVNAHDSPIPDEIRTLLASWDDPEMPDDARARLNDFLSHYQGENWYYAVKHADEGETDELRALLLTPEAEMTDDGRALLNDFVWRYQKIEKKRFNRDWDVKARQRLGRALARGLKKKRARPATPIYARSDLDAKIYCALHELRTLRKIFGRAHVPVERVAALWKISESTLENALEGKRGSNRRKAVRRREAMPRHLRRGK